MKPNYQNRNLLKKTYFKYSGLHKDLADYYFKADNTLQNLSLSNSGQLWRSVYVFKTNSYWQPQRRGIRSFYSFWFVCAQIDTSVLFWAERDSHMFIGEGTNV